MTIFRRKKRNNVEDQKETEKAPAPFDIGLTGTVEELRRANNAALNKINERGSHCGEGDQLALQKGAIKAFLEEDRPENIQAILSSPDEFAVQKQYTLAKEKTDRKILSILIKGSDNPAAVITRALEKVPEAEKQVVLDNLLCDVVKDKEYRGDEAFVAALLGTGAEANFKSGDGFNGVALARAIENSQSLPVIELLVNNGASFKDARFLMEIREWKEETIKKLERYRQEITGEPAMIEVEPGVWQQMIDQMKEVTERLDRLSPPAAASGAKQSGALKITRNPLPPALH